MKRDPKLIENRIKKVGLFFEIKRSQGLASKVAVIEIAEALCIGQKTVLNDLTIYRNLSVYKRG